MKKHKSVVSILLAVMMVFAMMPAMVFAADTEPTATWSGYDSVTFAGGTGAYEKYNGTYQTTKTFNTVAAVVVDVKDPEIGGVDVGYLKTKAGTKAYYDLSKAVLAYSTDGTLANAKELFNTYASVTDFNKANGLIFTAPDGTYTGSTAPKVFVPADSAGKIALGGNWEGVIKTDPATIAAKDEDQDVKVFVDVTWTEDPASAGVLNAVAEKTVKIKAASHGTLPTSLDNHLFKDEVKDDAAHKMTSHDVTAAYDGKEHTLIAAPVKGYTVKYTVFNSKTGQWEAVDAVTFKDAAAKVSARATYFDDAKASDANYKGETPLPFSVTVSASTKSPSVAFTGDPKAPDTFVKGKYDPWSLVVVSNTEAKEDEAALLAYFKDAYTIEETSTSTFDATAYTWSFKPVTPAPKTTDYAILANYTAPFSATGSYDVTILESDPSDDYEVTFTKAITSKTYKGSKTTSKGKLKKNQTIQFKAEAANGATVKYKLVNVNTSKIKIDKATGKVTIKKGLTKGTYKFKVKAYVPGEKDAYELQSVTIKLKK